MYYSKIVQSQYILAQNNPWGLDVCPVLPAPDFHIYNPTSNVQPLKAQNFPDMKRYISIYQTYEFDRRQLIADDNQSGYFELLCLPPEPDVILGRAAEVTALILSPTSYDIPMETRGRLYTSYWAATGRTLVTLFEVNRDINALDLAIAASDRLFATSNKHYMTRDEYTKNIEPGWAVNVDGITFNEIMANGAIVTPMLDLLLLAQDDPLVENRLGKTRIRYWLDEIKPILIQFEDTMIEEENYTYFTEPHNSDMVEAWNHISIYTASLVKYSVLTDDEDTIDLAKKILNFYSTFVQEHENGTVSWPYTPKPGSMQGLGEDIWKGSISIELPLTADRYDFFFQKGHTEKIARILSRNIFLEDGRIDRGISPGFTISLDEMPQSIVSMISQWRRLSCYDASIDTLISSYFANRMELLSDGYLTNSRVAMYSTAIWQKHRVQKCK